MQVILQDALTGPVRDLGPKDPARKGSDGAGGGWAGAKIGTEDRMNTANTAIDKWLFIFPIPPATIVSKSREESQEDSKESDL